MEIKKKRIQRNPRKPKTISPKNLLKNKFPELIPLWNKDKNIGIDVNTISYCSTKTASWLCKTGNRDHDYEATIRSRTQIRNDKLPGCKKCFDNSTRLQDKTLIDEHCNNYVQNKFLIEIGDETEVYVQQLLIEMNCYQEVNVLGSLGADADVSVIHNDHIYYAQVKTLSHIKDEMYRAYDVNGYPDNMLIIMVNEKRNRFALDFAGNLKTYNILLSFHLKTSKYKNIMYTDIDEFKIKLKESIVKSCTVIKFSDNIYKEYLSLKRFEIFCTKNNIQYIRNITNGNTVDGTINGYQFQAKFVTLPEQSKIVYTVQTKKSCGVLNGQVMKSSYHLGDFDYLIVEVGGTKNDIHQYENNFCIIPAKELINENILKTDTCSGKKKMMVCPPDYKREHWTKKYWNIIPEEILI